MSGLDDLLSNVNDDLSGDLVRSANRKRTRLHLPFIEVAARFGGRQTGYCKCQREQPHEFLNFLLLAIQAFVSHSGPPQRWP